MSKKQTPESNVLSAVCDFLAMRGYVFWRQNNTGVYDVANKRFRAMPKYSMKGVSDIIVLIDGTAWFLEIKAPKGKQSPDQKVFERIVKNAGWLYEIITSIDELLALGF